MKATVLIPIIMVLVVGGFFYMAYSASTTTPAKTASSSSQAVAAPSGEAIAMDIHKLVNQYRANPSAYKITINPNGESEYFSRSGPVPALSYNPQLANIALGHSEDMANNNYFAHYNSANQGPTERAQAVGFNCEVNMGTYRLTGLAENLARGSGYDESQIAKATVDGWVLSPEHRSALESNGSLSEGIGVAFSNSGQVYVTEDFC